MALTDHLILAERYFEEARRLAAGDERIPGWLGGVQLALGTVHQDERLWRDDWSRRMRDDDPPNDPPYIRRSELSCTGCHAR